MSYALDLDSLPLPAIRKIAITDLPVELLANKILPFCKVRDMLSLGCTNRFFALITSDGMFWRRKLAIDYNFTGSETNRTSGWKFIYLKSRKPRLFTWGSVMFLPRSVTGVSTHSHMFAQLSQFRTIFQSVPKNSPKMALLDAPLPFETRLGNLSFVNLAASE